VLFVRRRWAALLLALVTALSGVVVTATGPAAAAPGASAGDDGEGGSKALLDQLDSASRAWLDAQDALAASKKRQQELTASLARIATEIGPRQATIDELVAQTYRVGRLGPVSALLTADSSSAMLDRAETLETMAVQQDAALRALKTARDQQTQAKLAIEATIRDQVHQVNVMNRQKARAENALKAANAGQNASSPGGSTAGSATVSKFTNNSDSCSVNDPTSGGCITPRMLNAMKVAQANGFTHYVHCWRQQDSGEHPKGRACDFAADKTGFGGVATGASKDYGNRLANFFIHNSSNLGVLYVIWFERIWLPSSGWKAYTRGNGDPSSDHTNHVHLSVR
jgi:peptidoglycan DL-endopeptidase CwlO